MYKFLKKVFFCSLIFPIIFFNSCRTFTQENSFSDDLQSERESIAFPDISPLEKEQLDTSSPSNDNLNSSDTPSPPDVWDVRDVDISHIDASRKLISFTFDDAPTRHLENLFAVFAAYNEKNPDCKASGTLFFNGKLFDNENFQLLHTALAMGFELGNHTYSHYDLTTLSPQDLQEEIKKTDEILEKADGKAYHLLRAPFGSMNEYIKENSPAPWIDWTIDTIDWTGISAENICNTVLENCFSGAIVLFHDGYPQTIEALKKLLPTLKENGYQIVSVSQLAKMHHCTLQKGKVYIRARKQN